MQRRRPSTNLLIGAACLLTLLLSPGIAARADQPVDIEVAKQQFLTSCGICHTVEPGAPPRQGPNLAGVYGRKAGTLAGYTYSKALKEGGWTWDEASLDAWIENAQQAHPGTSMMYKQANPDKRALVIAYLKSLAGAK